MVRRGRGRKRQEETIKAIFNRVGERVRQKMDREQQRD